MKGVIATASLLSVGAQVTTVMAAEEALSPEQVGQMSQQEVDSRKPQEEQRLQEVNIKIAELNSKIGQYANERAELERQIAAKKAEVDADKASLSATESELKATAEAATQAQNAAQSSVDKIQEELNKLEADKKALEDKIENLKKEQQELSPKVADTAPLEADVLAKTAELNSKQAELATRQSALDTVTNQLNDLQAQKATLTQELETKKAELKTLEDSKSQTEATGTAKTEEKNTLDNQIADVTQAITNKQAEIDALGVNEATLTAQKQTLEQNVASITSEISTIEQDLETKRTRLAEITSPELKTQIQTKKDEVASLANQISALDNTIAEQTQAKTNAEQAKLAAEQTKNAKESEKTNIQNSLDIKTQELATLVAKQKEVEDKIAQATDNSSFLNFLKANGGSIPTLKTGTLNASATQPQTWDEYLEFVMNTPIKMVVQNSKDYNQVKTVREWLNGDETVLTSAKDNLMRMVNTVTELNNRRKAAGLEPVKVDVRSMLTEAIAVAIGANNYWYHTYVPGADNLFTATGQESWFDQGTTYEKESMKGWWDSEKPTNGGHYKWFSDQYGKLYAISPYMFIKTGANQRLGVGKDGVPSFYSGVGLERSEEHTSELQSQR